MKTVTNPLETTEIDERIKELTTELKTSKTSKHKSEVKRMIDYWLDQRLGKVRQP